MRRYIFIGEFSLSNYVHRLAILSEDVVVSVIKSVILTGILSSKQGSIL